MEVSEKITDLDEVTKEVEVTIPASVYSSDYDSALDEVAKTAKIKGFRPGAAPKNIIEKMHGARVRMEVAHRLMSAALTDVIKRNEIPMIGDPEIDMSEFEPEKDLSFTAKIYLFPTPAITGYDSFEVEVPKREITDKEVDELIERLRESKAKMEPLKFRNTAKAGDIIDAQLKVQLEGEEDNSPPEPLNIAIGEGHLPEALEEGIVGMEIGESKVIEGSIPETHQNEMLRGKNATFTVVLNALSEKILPEVDDDFAKELELEADTVLALRLELNKKLEEELEREQKAAAQAKILDQLVERNQFTLPQLLVDEEIRSLLMRQGLIDPKKMDPSKMSMEPFREGLGEIASKRVRTAIAVDSIADAENLEVSEEEIQKAIAEIAEENSLPVEQVQKILLEGENASNFGAEQKRNKVLEFLHDRAKISYVDPPAEDEKSQEEAPAEAEAAAK